PVPHHARGRHEYSIPRTVLDADVVINIPKLKTHKKSGVTLALKSCIGLTNEKYWLPHYTSGTPSQSGDEFPFPPPLWVRIENQLQRFPLPAPLDGHSLIVRAPKLAEGRSQNGFLHGFIMEGSWEGNDTIWRTVLDLNQVLFYADRAGRMTDRPQRRYLAIVDGIIAGEGEGPLASTPRHAGLLIAGRDPVLVDAACARAMGYGERSIQMIHRALAGSGRALLPSSDVAALRVVLDGPAPAGAFVPPKTWPTLLADPQPLV
ncbi:MAG: Iron-sulfur cluster-binding protein, partial [bacterium]|nr:Iron-sulfur cluster-binding protein [bacterium]